MPETAPLPTTDTYGQITEEGLEKLRGRLNVEHEIKEPFLRFVNDDSIRHVARAIGDTNPLWIDRGVWARLVVWLSGRPAGLPIWGDMG